MTGWYKTTRTRDTIYELIRPYVGLVGTINTGGKTSKYDCFDANGEWIGHSNTLAEAKKTVEDILRKESLT